MLSPSPILTIVLLEHAIVWLVGRVISVIAKKLVSKAVKMAELVYATEVVGAPWIGEDQQIVVVELRLAESAKTPFPALINITVLLEHAIACRDGAEIYATVRAFLSKM